MLVISTVVSIVDDFVACTAEEEELSTHGVVTGTGLVFEIDVELEAFGVAV